MASPAIRAFHVARELSGRFETVLVVPALTRSPTRNRRSWASLARFDAVVAQRLPREAMRYLAVAPTHVVYDLYTPVLPEGLAMLDAEGEDRSTGFLTRLEDVLQRFACAVGNALFCPGERQQRDLWLGVLEGLERIDLERYRNDRTLRDLVDVVPFSAPGRAARAFGLGPAGRVLRDRPARPRAALIGRRAQLDEPGDRDRGRRARRRAPSRREAVRARARAAAEAGRRAPRRRARGRARCARPLRLLRAEVGAVRGAGGVPARGPGVAAYCDLLKARFAFRARLLDHFWAGLPTLTTRGDVLGELVARRGLGRVLDFGDVDGWSRAIVELLDHEGECARIRRNLESIPGEFGWPRVGEPLVRLLGIAGEPVRLGVAARALEAEAFALRARLRLSRLQSAR